MTRPSPFHDYAFVDAARLALEAAGGNATAAARELGIGPRAMQLWARKLRLKDRGKLRLLFLDIETAPNICYTWDTFRPFIALDHIVSPGYTLCFSAKWMGESNVQFYSLRTQGDAMGLTESAWKLMDDADVVCTYNGNKFDLPVLRRDFVLYGHTPPSFAHSVDLYRTVKAQFRFVSNKLDFVTQQLGLGTKVKHKGMQLWAECMKGDDEAWATMEQYNRQDVVLLENLYWRLLPYIKGHPNMGLWLHADTPTCPFCGSTDLAEGNLIRRALQSYQAYVCQDCGGHSHSRLRIAAPAKGVLRL